MRADISYEFDIVERVKPIRIVDHNRSILSLKREKLGHLLLKSVAVVLYRLIRHHLTHIRSAGGIAYLSRTAADKHYGFMSCLLHIAHDHKLHKMTDVQTVSRRVKSYIKRYAFTSQKFIKFLFPYRLFNKASFAKHVHYVSCDFHFAILK